MYFHNDQKIGWGREPARTICTEFFSVRRSPWRHYSFITQASTGQQLTSAKRCSACSQTVRTLNAACPRWPFLCLGDVLYARNRASSGPPSRPPSQATGTRSIVPMEHPLDLSLPTTSIFLSPDSVISHLAHCKNS